MGKKARIKKVKRAVALEEDTPLSRKYYKVNKNVFKIAFPLFLASILIVGAYLRIQNVKTVDVRSPDEKTYTYQAKVITQNSGVQGVKKLLVEYRSNKNLWIHPPPTRIGYLFPLSLTMTLLNNDDVVVGSYLSCFFSIAAMLILVTFGLRFFNRWVTLYALLFLSVSPMDIMIARRTWQDAMLGCMGLLIIYLSCEVMRSARKILWYIPFIFAGSLIMLIKESGAVVYGLCTAWIFYVLAVRKKLFFKAFLLATASGLSVILSVSLLAHITGGFSVVLEVLNNIKEGLPTNTYAIEFQTGPWYRFLGAFWVISPLNAVLYPLGIFSTFITRKKHRETALGVVIFTILFIFITLSVPYMQNVRYVSVLFAPFYLISGFGLWYALTLVKLIVNNFRFSIILVCVIIVLVASSLGDYARYKKFFAGPGVMDMSVRFVWSSYDTFKTHNNAVR